MLLNIKKIAVISAMGIGLGVGVTVSVLFPQSTVQAIPTHAQNIHKVQAQSVTVDGTFVYPISTESNTAGLVSLRSLGLGVRSLTVLAGTGRNLFAQLSTVALGTTLTVLGDNNGTYTYTVTDVLTIQRGYATSLYNDQSEKLIITVLQFPWDTTEVAVVGSYRRAQ